jgi:hypothetical protein
MLPLDPRGSSRLDGAPELHPTARRNDSSSHYLGNKLQAIANTQDGNIGFKEFKGERGASFSTNRIRSARENNTFRFGDLDFLQGVVIGCNFTIY